MSDEEQVQTEEQQYEEQAPVEEQPPAEEQTYEAPVEETHYHEEVAHSSSGSKLDPAALVKEVKELALKGDVDGLKTLLTSKRGDIEGLVKSKKEEIQHIVEDKINEYKRKGEEKKAEILSLIEIYKGKGEEFQLKAKDQYDTYFQQLMALVDSIKAMVLEKIAEIKQKLGMA